MARELPIVATAALPASPVQSAIPAPPNRFDDVLTTARRTASTNEQSNGAYESWVGRSDPVVTRAARRCTRPGASQGRRSRKGRLDPHRVHPITSCAACRLPRAWDHL